jgi:hypothetical protein
MFLISAFQIGKLGVDLTKVGVAYAKQPIVYEGNRYVGYVTSTTEDTSSGVMTTMPRYKGVYNKALDFFGDSSEFKAQPNFYEFKVKNVPKPKGTPEDITFNAGQVLETKRISEGTFTQRKEFFDVLKSDYMNTDLDVQLYSKRSYNRKGFNSVGNFAGYYQPSTKTIYANLYKSNFLEAKDTLLHEYFHYKYDITGQKFWTPNKANYGLIKTVLSSTTKIEDKRAIFSLGFEGYKKQDIIEEYLVRQKTARYLRDTNYAPFGKMKVPTTNLGKIGDNRVITNFMTVSKTTPDVMIFKEGNFIKRDVDVGIGLGINKERTATPYYFYSETQQGILPITKGTIYSNNVKTPFTIIQLSNMEKGFGGLPSKDYNIFNTFQQTTNPNTMGNIKKLNIINGMQDLEINQVGLINKVSTVNKVGVINRVGFLDIDNTNLKVNVLNRVGVLNQVGLLNKVIVTNKIGVLNRVGNLNRIKVIERVGLKMDTLQSMRTLQRSKTNILSPSINAPFYPDIPTFIPPFLDIGADFGGLTNRKIKAKRITRYTPSYTALVFGIKGRKPRGVETGARIRPITKGFSWFKL